jgi:UDP-N-acetyl-D-mannosaminuronic acid dehydrogenase
MSSKGVEERIVLAKQDDTLKDVIARMGRCGDKYFGLALIVDKSLILKGVLSSGDVLRLVADGENLEQKVVNVMRRNPITAYCNETDEKILNKVRGEMSRRTSGKRDYTRYVPLVNSEGVVQDIADIYSLLSKTSRQSESVEVYGLGFVGLTLSVALASRGHFVSGIDNNSQLVSQLMQGNPHVYEPRLSDMLNRSLLDLNLSFHVAPTDNHHRVVIIAVGTPVNPDGEASLSALRAVCKVVAPRLERDDLVMLRSTVPVGTTRGIVRQLLEADSGLIAGKDFHLAFTPERTVEGMAMQELTSLPQIVGGLTKACAEKATAFWQTLTDGIVRVDSLEASELVKLVNNSYRDLSFAFSNGLALLSDHFNLDAGRIISAANEGYPRNHIPKPSPGVGGYCLTKDPFLYASVNNNGPHALLSRQARYVNEEAALYPVSVVKRFSKRHKYMLSELSILVIGMAFKGLPETNDLRGSISIDVCHKLEGQGSRVLVYDAVVPQHTLKDLGYQTVDIIEAARFCNVVLILNNHPSNIPKGLIMALSGKKSLLFDGWSLLDRIEVEQYDDIVYASMGYMTQ